MMNCNESLNELYQTNLKTMIKMIRPTHQIPVPLHRTVRNLASYSQQELQIKSKTVMS